MSKRYKPSQYKYMILEAFQTMNAPQGLSPHAISNYIEDHWKIECATEIIRKNISKALNDGLENNLFSKTSFGYYNTIEATKTTVKRKKSSKSESENKEEKKVKKAVKRKATKTVKGRQFQDSSTDENDRSDEENSSENYTTIETDEDNSSEISTTIETDEDNSSENSTTIETDLSSGQWTD